MTLLATNSTATTAASEPTLSPAVLETLSSRFRPAGLFSVVLRPDGSVASHDTAAEPFFARYALPFLQDTESIDNTIAAQAKELSAGSEVCAWRRAGLLFYASPHVERRLVTSILLLVAKADDFTSRGEEVMRACGRLGLDGEWLAGQASTLAGYGSEAIHRQGQMLAGTLRDQLSVGRLTRELDTLSSELANTYEELNLIYQISSGMKVNRRAGDFFRQTCLDVLNVINVRGIGVALQGDVGQQTAPALYGELNLPQQTIDQLSERLIAMLRERPGPLVVDDLSQSEPLNWMAPHTTRLLAVPLQRQDQVLGCLFALDKVDGEFDSVDAKLLNSIANESAIYLENVMLFDDVHGLMMGLMHSLSSAIDAKDAYTCGHSERVALVSRHLSQQVGLCERDVDEIYMASLLHDVGKIGVPEAVLQKAGRLTAEEFEQMKRHPQIGARILQDVKQIRKIIPGVLYHHERFDGRGYPEGLAGANIPLMGRIICLGDCFDAMTSNRTYRKALPLEVALNEIRRCAGTQFDPLLTETFLKTGADGFRELLRDHQGKSKKLRDLQESIRAA